MKKVSVEVNTITLPVNGRKMTFSAEELIVILEQHFENKELEAKKVEVTQKPTEGEWFMVDPNSINQNLFQKKRNDSRQERTRKIILEAFIEVKNNPKKYAKPFKTMMPKKTWLNKEIKELIGLAEKDGNHIADWVEQALEWAQRISNGESWEAICNNPDTAKWYRLVIWKNGKYKIVGGSSERHSNYSASDIDTNVLYSVDRLDSIIPSIVDYD